jgi:hypothetical protein
MKSRRIVRTSNDKPSRRSVPFIRHTAQSMRSPNFHLKSDFSANTSVHKTRLLVPRHINHCRHQYLVPSQQRYSVWFVTAKMPLHHCTDIFIRSRLHTLKMLSLGKTYPVPETLLSTPPLTTNFQAPLSPNSRPLSHNMERDASMHLFPSSIRCEKSASPAPSPINSTKLSHLPASTRESRYTAPTSTPP